MDLPRAKTSLCGHIQNLRFVVWNSVLDRDDVEDRVSLPLFLPLLVFLAWRIERSAACLIRLAWLGLVCDTVFASMVRRSETWR